jgi:hypothetical protein
MPMLSRPSPLFWPLSSEPSNTTLAHISLIRYVLISGGSLGFLQLANLWMI